MILYYNPFVPIMFRGPNTPIALRFVALIGWIYFPG